MNKYTRSRASLFLMELIINILFFCILLTICMQFFVRSYTLRKESKALTHAVSCVSNAAEIYRSTPDGSATEFLEYFPLSKIDDNRVTIFYDIDFKECPPSDAVYQLLTDMHGTSNDCAASFTFSSLSSSEIIYSLNENFHVPISVTIREGGMSDE